MACESRSGATVRNGQDPSNGPPMGSTWNLRSKRKQWPDRKNLSQVAQEFEAESVSYLVCARLGIDTASDEYLAGYVRRCPVAPAISLDRVMKSVWLLEQMGRANL